MKCVFCQGKLEKGTIPFHIDKVGIHVTFDAVLALICHQCGQAMFQEAETRTIEGVIDAIEKKGKKLAKAA